MHTSFRVFAYLRRYPGLATSLLSCAVIMAVLQIVFPGITKAITGEVIPERDYDRLLPLTFLAAGAFLATNLFNALRIIINNTFEQKVIFDIRSDLYRKIQRLPMQWFDNKRTGDVMTRVSEDVMAMERVLIDGIEQGVVAVLQVLVVGIFLFVISAQLALVAVAPMPFLIAGAWTYARLSPRLHRRVRETTSDMNSLLHDNIDGIQQIKSFTRESAEQGRFDRASNRVREATIRLMRVWAAYNPGMELCRNLGYVLVISYGAWLVMQAPNEEVFKDRNGDFFGFIVALGLLYEPISRLHGLNQIVQAGRAAGERVFEIIDSEEERDIDEGDSLPRPIRGHVAFERVSFSYDGDIATLEDVSLEARPGETIALVGHTGAGKSTIINLLTRFYEAESGVIRIDGAPIDSLKKVALRDAMGYVTQESFLFNGTVRENLQLAHGEAGDDTMWEALRAANAAAFIEALPEKLGTRVGERGVKLSVGEKQRIAIARVILKNPPILLLDEATASVDTETENLIQEALQKLMTGRTSFVIAHRLSTVRNADRIYVLDRGRVAESGDHEALQRNEGVYATLCRQSLMM